MHVSVTASLLLDGPGPQRGPRGDRPSGSMGLRGREDRWLARLPFQAL